MKTANPLSDPMASKRPFLSRLGLRLLAIIAGCAAAFILAYLIMLPVMLLGVKLGPGLGSTAWGLGFFAGYQVYRMICVRFKLKLRSKRGEEELIEKEENENANSASSLYENGDNQIINGGESTENVNFTEVDNATKPDPKTMEEVLLNDNEIKPIADLTTEEVEVPRNKEQYQSGEGDSAIDNAVKKSASAVIESDETYPPKRRNTKQLKKICLIILAIFLAAGLFFAGRAIYLPIHTKAEHEQLVQNIKYKINCGTIKQQEIEEAITALEYCDQNHSFCNFNHIQTIEELLDLYIQQLVDYCKANVERSDIMARDMFKWDGTDIGKYCDKYYKGEKSEYISSEYVHNYTKIAVKILLYAAEQGDPDSQFTLGCFYNGADFTTEENDWDNYTMLGNSVDNKKAAYWYLQAAEQGQRTAMGNLGNAYMNGKGVTRNEEKGVYWIQRAANLGSAFYQCRLGDYYRDGVYVRIGSHEEYEKDMFGGYKKITVDDYDYNKAIIPKDIEQAKYWWRLAAENGNKTAKERLQQIYD